MKVLLVDYMSGYGHQSFNRIHINSIKSCGANIILLSKEGYFDYLNDNSLTKLYIPSFLFKSFKAGFSAQILVRLLDIFKLIYVKWVSFKTNPDFIVFLDYDILSFFVFRSKRPVALINHFNVDDLNNGTKLNLTKALPSHYIFINLNNYIDNRHRELIPNSRSIIIPHGLDCCILDKDKSLLNRYNLSKYIFCPISSSFSKSLLIDVLTSNELEEYLNDNQMKICLKGVAPNVKIGDHVVLLPSYIDTNLYNSVIGNAFAVFLPYDSSFKYRVSGVLHECFANNIPAICSKTDSFKQYENYMNYESLVLNSADLIKSLESLKKCETYYKNLDLLSPNIGWSMLLNNSID